MAGKHIAREFLRNIEFELELSPALASLALLFIHIPMIYGALNLNSFRNLEHWLSESLIAAKILFLISLEDKIFQIVNYTVMYISVWN